MTNPTLTFPPVIDASMRADYVSCPHKFFRRYLQDLQLPGQSVHLHFGSAFAHGINIFREQFYLPTSINRGNLNQSLATAFKALVAYWGDADFPANSTKTLERCLGALEAYTHQYPPATDHIQPLYQDGHLHTEFNFALPLPIPHPETWEPILYSGRFDMLALMNGTMKVIEDDKTTSQLGASWGQQWRLRAQFTGYAWGAEEFGHRIEGVVVRGISILKGSYGHAEVIESRPKWMIARWKEQLHRDIRRMIEDWELYSRDLDPFSFSQNLDSTCAAYGGCAFLDLCSSSNPDKWLETFEVRHYDPLGTPD